MCMVKSTMALASPEFALSSAPRFGLAGRPFSGRVACCAAASSAAFAFAAASASVACIAASCAGEGEGAGEGAGEVYGEPASSVDASKVPGGVGSE